MASRKNGVRSGATGTTQATSTRIQTQFHSRTSRATASQGPSFRRQLPQRQQVLQVQLPRAASTSKASRKNGVRSGATGTTQATSTRTQTQFRSMTSRATESLVNELRGIRFHLRARVR